MSLKQAPSRPTVAGMLSGLGPRPSTRRFWNMQKERGHSWWQRLHAWAYAGFPYGYIGAAIGERREQRWLRPLFAPFLLKALDPQSWGESYHGKVMPTASATRLVRVQEPLEIVLSEQVIPFQTARELVLSPNQPIVVLDCPCRLARERPCLPLDVCLIMGEPFASFILDHQPEHARAISADEAVAILEAEAARGHVHHAFFKDAMLGRFYAICNCCSCCCGAMSAHRQGTPMLISSGFVAQVDDDICAQCGTCAQICPFGAIELKDRVVIDPEHCMGCGVCAQHCPENALSLARDARKPAPLELLV